jgi:sigma-E factor negative regulatory protein RseC
MQPKEQEMATKKGRVTQVNSDNWAVVVTHKEDACHNCEAAQFCHALADCSKMETRVLNRAGAAVGDFVCISLSSATVLKSALLLYLVPTAGLLAGAIAGAQFYERFGIGETAAALLSGFAGLIASFIIVKFISKRQALGDKLTPVITRVIKPTSGFDLSRIPAGPGHSEIRR